MIEIFGDLTPDEVQAICDAAKLHREFEAARHIQYVCERSRDVFEVGTFPDDYTIPGAFDKGFFVRWDGHSYVVDQVYAEFS